MTSSPTSGFDAGRALHLTYRFRLLPTKAQHARLWAALDQTRDLYNAALQERIGAYRKAGKSFSYFDQVKGITALRRDAEWTCFAYALQQWPLKQVDLAFKAFFSRLKSGASRVGYPRFRSRDRFKTFGFTNHDGWKCRERKVIMKGIGAVRMRMHREMRDEPKSLKIKRVGNRWFALITVEEMVAPNEHGGPSVGLDVGLVHLATLSTGEHVASAKHGSRLSSRVRRAQRALARAKRGSRNRKKAKERFAALKLREGNARNTHLHQISANLTRRFSTIVVEDLALSSMVRSARGSMELPGINVAAKSALNRSLQDASFRRLKELLRYKAERAGGELVEVNPRHTSQTCSACGVIDKLSRCSQSRFLCTGCGHEMNADWNAALNIARLGGVAIPGVLNLEAA